MCDCKIKHNKEANYCFNCGTKLESNPLLTLKQAYELTGIKISTLRMMCKFGQLNYTQHIAGGKLYIRRNELNKIM